MSSFSKEKHPSKVGALFWTLRDARRIVDKIQHDPATESVEVTVLHPTDTDVDSKLQPDSQGVKRTLFRTHRNFSLIGIGAGLGIFCLALLLDAREVTASPLLAATVLTFAGAICGLILAGLISLRPDHDKLLRLSSRARKSGCWMVVAHTGDPAQSVRAREHMRTRAVKTVATL